MSIWSSFAQIEPLREGQYGAHIAERSWLDLADTGLRGNRGELLRILVDEGDRTEATAVLDRSQATELRDQLTSWLDRTKMEDAKDEVQWFLCRTKDGAVLDTWTEPAPSDESWRDG